MTWGFHNFWKVIKISKLFILNICSLYSLPWENLYKVQKTFKPWNTNEVKFTTLSVEMWFLNTIRLVSTFTAAVETVAPDTSNREGKEITARKMLNVLLEHNYIEGITSVPSNLRLWPQKTIFFNSKNGQL